MWREGWAKGREGVCFCVREAERDLEAERERGGCFCVMKIELIQMNEKRVGFRSEKRVGGLSV